MVRKLYHLSEMLISKHNEYLSSGPQEKKSASSLPNARPKHYWMEPQSLRFVTQAPQPLPHRQSQIISQLHPREDGERVKLCPELWVQNPKHLVCPITLFWHIFVNLLWSVRISSPTTFRGVLSRRFNDAFTYNLSEFQVVLPFLYLKTSLILNSNISCGVTLELSWWASTYDSAKTIAGWVWHLS